MSLWSFLVLLAWGIALIVYLVWKMLTLPRKSKPLPEYIEYGTLPVFADKWHDHKSTGKCSVCGMDDAPIVHKLFGYTDRPECKYCMELRMINWHLQERGTRR